MRALSFQQYWLWAITDMDKRIENRTWSPPGFVIGERICLHASKKIQLGSAEAILKISGQEVQRVHVPLGSIVATAVIREWVMHSADKWFYGPYGWVLESVVKLDNPIPARGALNLWIVDLAVEWEIQEELVRKGIE
jgi:hypothetical protein